jgi:hypothetical protein
MLEVSELSDFSRLTTFISNREKLYDKMQERAPYGKNTNREQMRDRSPMIITNTNWLGNGRYILFWTNPSTATWNFQLRGSEQQTRTGYVMHYWRDAKRTTYWDNPVVNFTFQSGNMLPVRLIQSEDILGNTTTVFLPPGLLDYYDFFELLDDKKIMPDGRPNLTYIVYHSLVYPSITLYGHFQPDNITMTDSTDTPDGITWTASFRIKGSSPRLYRSGDLRNAWMSQFNTTQI